MATLNISIPNEMRHWIDSQVASGHFANASDYIRDLIRHNQSEKEAIRMALVEGELSGESSLTVADIISEQKKIINNKNMREKIEAYIQAHTKTKPWLRYCLRNDLQEIIIKISLTLIYKVYKQVITQHQYPY